MSLLISDPGGKAHHLSELAHYIRVRMFGDPDLTIVPRMPTYETMLATIKAALQYPALASAAPKCIRLFSVRHNAVVSPDAWPIVFKDVDVLVVRCDVEQAPETCNQEEEQLPIPSRRAMTRVCDDDEDDLYAKGGEHVQTPICSNQGFHGTLMPVAEEITGSAKIRGVSLLPHIRKHMPIAKRRLLTDYAVKPARIPDRRGFPAMTEHFDLEKTYVQGHCGAVWVVPPRAKHQAVRSVLLRDADAKQAGLTGPEGTWVAHHRVRGKNNPKDDRKLLDNGKDLYDALIRAHGVAHYNAAATWKKLKDKYVGPSQLFVKMWVERCPTCAM